MKRLLAAAILTFVPITLAGCSSGVDHSSHSMPSTSSSYSADEIMFAQMMVPHHQQALDMVAIAETKTTDKGMSKYKMSMSALLCCQGVRSRWPCQLQRIQDHNE